MRVIRLFLIFTFILLLILIIPEKGFADEKEYSMHHDDRHHKLIFEHNNNTKSNLDEILNPKHHRDYLEWNFGDKKKDYPTPSSWGFPNYNNFLEYNFTRTWNHTMVEHTNHVYVKNSTHHWWTGIQLNRVGQIDTINGLYSVELDYWIQIFARNDTADFSEEEDRHETNFVHFVNMVQDPEPIFKLSKGIKQKKNYHQISLAGTFQNDMISKKWPFEDVQLKFIVEPNYNYTHGTLSDNIQFHVWPYPLVKEDELKIPGFDITSYSINVTDHQYSEGDTFSRYTASIGVERNWFDSFFKYIFPISVMTSLAVLVMMFPRGDYMTKIELNAIFLLGILFFVQVITEEVPSSGGLTVFDLIVLSSYSILIVTMIVPAIKWLDEKKLKQKIEDYEWWESKHDKKFDRIQTEIGNNLVAHALENNNEEKKDLKQKIEKMEEELSEFNNFKTKSEKIKQDLKRIFEKSIKSTDDKMTRKNKQEEIPKDVEKLKEIFVKSEKERKNNEEIKNEIIYKYERMGCPENEIKEGIDKLKEKIDRDKEFLKKELEEFGVSEKFLTRGEWIKFLLTFEDEDEAETLGKKSRHYNIFGLAAIAVLVSGGLYVIINIMSDKINP